METCGSWGMYSIDLNVEEASAWWVLGLLEGGCVIF